MPEPNTPAEPNVSTNEQQAQPTSENKWWSLDNILTLKKSDDKIPTTESYIKELANDINGEKIKFSIGLENLAFNNGSYGGYGGYGNNITDVTLSGEIDGMWISDPSLKQVAMVTTVFQSFPIYINGINDPYSMCVDYTSTGDGQGTNLGYLTIGQLGCPDKYEINDLNSVASNTKGGGFKVGASAWSKKVIDYFNHYYPDAGITMKQFVTLRRKCLLNAEVVKPTGPTTGKAYKIKIVDEGPFSLESTKYGSLWKIDVMGAFTMLTENKGLFNNLMGKYHGNYANLDNINFIFPFKDSSYDIMKGEIAGYTPEAVIKIANGDMATSAILPGKINKSTELISSYGCDKEICRVKFYIEPEHRAEAESICGKKLPDDLFKTNGTYGMNAPIVSFNSLPPDAGILEKITYAGALVNQNVISRGLVYGNCGGYMKNAEGIIVTKNKIDCASGVNVILANAGIIDILRAQSERAQSNTVWYRGNWLKYLMPGYTATQVPPEQVAPGDVILYDRGRDSYNHAYIYMGSGKAFDYGSGVGKPQPRNRATIMVPHDTKTGYVKKVVVWRIGSVGTQQNNSGIV